ncbi:hypothetical protein ACIRYZ_23680 [Kitasatospora sp. NPDC101155]|uniref:hypothetical protein n=1 Tax=Kitasatospora sp. NPDC101155 TaxID=3364097 RepID=UPI00382ED66D
MTSMTHDAREITGGVDTHGLTHHTAVIDSIGRHLADREFPATVRGYRDLLDWMRSQWLESKRPALAPNTWAG